MTSKNICYDTYTAAERVNRLGRKYSTIIKVYPDRKVWKTGSGHNDAETGRPYISQTIHIEYDDNGRLDSFDCGGDKFFFEAVKTRDI